MGAIIYLAILVLGAACILALWRHDRRRNRYFREYRARRGRQ